MPDINTTTKPQTVGTDKHNTKSVALLSVNNLRFSYNAHFSVVIDDLAINQGENVVLTGPNGAGKTTILKLLAGLLPPHQGTVMFNGISVHQCSSVVPYHRRIGYVPQKPVLYNRTIAENVGLGLKIRGVAKEQRNRLVAEMLNRFGISHLADHNALKVSGGEARRAMLARALVLKPEILFLDEPFSDLDDKVKSEILTGLFTNSPLPRGGGGCVDDMLKPTIIMVTHDYMESDHFANHILKVSQGRIDF